MIKTPEALKKALTLAAWLVSVNAPRSQAMQAGNGHWPQAAG